MAFLSTRFSREVSSIMPSARAPSRKGAPRRISLARSVRDMDLLMRFPSVPRDIAPQITLPFLGDRASVDARRRAPIIPGLRQPAFAYGCIIATLIEGHA